MRQVDLLGREALHLAAQGGCTDVLRFLIDHCKVDINRAAGVGSVTPLHYAAKVRGVHKNKQKLEYYVILGRAKRGHFSAT